MSDEIAAAEQGPSIDDAAQALGLLNETQQEGEDAKSEDSEPAPAEAAEEAEGDETPEIEESDADEERELPRTVEEFAEATGLSMDDIGQLVVTVKTDGNQEEVNLSEALAGYQREADYRKKTGALADERKAHEAERAQWSEERQRDAAVLMGVLQHVQTHMLGEAPDPTLAEEDPAAYVAAKATFEQRAAAFGAMWQSVQARLQQTNADQASNLDAVKAAEMEKLKVAIPEFSDGTKNQQARNELKDYLAGAGYRPEEIANLYDHRTAVLAWKAMQYDRTKEAAQDLSKKVTKLPKFQKSGAKQGRSEQAQADRDVKFNRLRKSGSVEDAAALL